MWQNNLNQRDSPYSLHLGPIVFWKPMESQISILPAWTLKILETCMSTSELEG